MNDSNYRNHYIFNPNCICFRRRPSSSVVSVVSVVVVLRPSSVAVVRRRRPLSVRPSRPSVVVVVRRRQPANPRPHANFRKNIKIEVPQPREYAEQMAFDL